MLKLIVLSVLAVTMYATSTAQASLQVHHKPYSQMTRTEIINLLKRQVHKDRSVIRFWHHHRQLASAASDRQVHWAKVSLRIAGHNLHRMTRPVVTASHGVIAALMCIHSYEGSWTDPNAPYWGGLQMDMSFQSSYGPEFLHRWGTADHWPVWAQLKAGARAVAVRGYSPWPNTARDCGLG